MVDKKNFGKEGYSATSRPTRISQVYHPANCSAGTKPFKDKLSKAERISNEALALYFRDMVLRHCNDNNPSAIDD